MMAMWPRVLPIPVSNEETMVPNRHPGDDRQGQRDQHQGEKRVKLDHRDEQDQPNHRSWRRRGAGKVPWLSSTGVFKRDSMRGGVENVRLFVRWPAPSR